MNNAQWLLYNIGGIAELVAGVNGHYFADYQTPKREPSRPRTSRGNYGKNLMSHFDTRNMVRKAEKESQRTA